MIETEEPPADFRYLAVPLAALYQLRRRQDRTAILELWLAAREVHFRPLQLSLSQLQELTGLRRPDVVSLLRALQDLKLVTVEYQEGNRPQRLTFVDPEAHAAKRAGTGG